MEMALYTLAAVILIGIFLLTIAILFRPKAKKEKKKERPQAVSVSVDPATTIRMSPQRPISRPAPRPSRPVNQRPYAVGFNHNHDADYGTDDQYDSVDDDSYDDDDDDDDSSSYDSGSGGYDSGDSDD